ncbi:hypothetical protein AB0I55_24165 [Actinocatenispora sera]|uniref:hypothetical protein n=1 Tax=Actinocatenispora sera TaxID=390989 RepID=UPI0033D11D70
MSSPPPPPDGVPGSFGPAPPGPYPSAGASPHGWPAPGQQPAAPSGGYPSTGPNPYPAPGQYPAAGPYPMAGPNPGQAQPAPPGAYPPPGGYPPPHGYPPPAEYPSGVAGQILASERGRRVTDGVSDYFASASDQRQLRRRIVLIALVIAIPVFLIILAAALLPSLL